MKPLSWTSAAIIIGLPTLLGFVAWLIYILANPSRWCGVPVGAAISTGQKLPINDCTSIVITLVNWLGKGMIGLVIVIAIAFLTIVARDLKASVGIRGPGGFGANIGTDDIPAVQIKQPEGQPVPVSDESK